MTEPLNATSSQATRIGEWLLLIARIAGLALVIAGTGVLLMVLVEAWELYHQPTKIVSMAQSIEQATAIDSTLLGESIGKSADTHTVSYFLAWILAIALLSLVGRVAFWAIRAGGALLSPTAKPSDSNRRPVTEPANSLPPDYRPSHRTSGNGAPAGYSQKPRNTMR